MDGILDRNGSRDNMTALLVKMSGDAIEIDEGQRCTFLPGALYAHQHDRRFVLAYLKFARSVGHCDGYKLRKAAYSQDVKYLLRYQKELKRLIDEASDLLDRLEESRDSSPITTATGTLIIHQSESDELDASVKQTDTFLQFYGIDTACHHRFGGSSFSPELETVEDKRRSIARQLRCFKQNMVALEAKLKKIAIEIQRLKREIEKEKAGASIVKRKRSEVSCEDDNEIETDAKLESEDEENDGTATPLRSEKTLQRTMTLTSLESALANNVIEESVQEREETPVFSDDEQDQVKDVAANPKPTKRRRLNHSAD